MDFVLNERKYVESMLDSGYLGDNMYTSIYLMAKYYYYVHGMKKSEIVNKLDSIMSVVYDGYEKDKWTKFFERAIRNAKKYPLVEIESIPVTQKEFECINKLKYSAERKVAFTLLVIAKFMNICRSNNNDWVSSEPKNVFKLANVYVSRVDQARMYATLTSAGIITYSNKTGSVSARVLIIDNDGESVFDVEDMKNLGNTYLMSQGGKYAKCNKCKSVFKLGKHYQWYCSECSKKQNAVRIRVFNCIDCGCEVTVAAVSNRRCRCDSCTKIAKRNSVLRAVQKMREANVIQ